MKLEPALIHINHCYTDKQNLEKKLEMLIKNTRYECFSDYRWFKYNKQVQVNAP